MGVERAMNAGMPKKHPGNERRSSAWRPKPRRKIGCDTCLSTLSINPPSAGHSDEAAVATLELDVDLIAAWRLFCSGRLLPSITEQQPAANALTRDPLARHAGPEACCSEHHDTHNAILQ
eukprot:6212422-Pleurochrysis_carterae.AAC.2